MKPFSCYFKTFTVLTLFLPIFQSHAVSGRLGYLTANGISQGLNRYVLKNIVFKVSAPHPERLCLGPTLHKTLVQQLKRKGVQVAEEKGVAQFPISGFFKFLEVIKQVQTQHLLAIPKEQFAILNELTQSVTQSATQRLAQDLNHIKVQSELAEHMVEDGACSPFPSFLSIEGLAQGTFNYHDGQVRATEGFNRAKKLIDEASDYLDKRKNFSEELAIWAAESAFNRSQLLTVLTYLEGNTSTPDSDLSILQDGDWLDYQSARWAEYSNQLQAFYVSMLRVKQSDFSLFKRITEDLISLWGHDWN